MKKKLSVLLVTLALAAFGVGCDGGIEQIKNTVTIEAGQELEFIATEYFNVSEEDIAKVVFDTTQLDNNTVGQYEVVATYDDEEFTITVIVEDTTAPMVELVRRYVITNDLSSYNPMDVVDGIYDASEYSVAFTRFEKTGALDVMTESALNQLMNTIVLPGNQEELATLGTEGIPSEEGIYRTVLSVADVHGNTQLEEVYVILDKTGALIEDVEDKVVEVEKEDIEKEPEVNPADYTITDNVDGPVSAENIAYTLELRDAEKHEYIIHVSYTDRAGNVSTADFLIIVKEKEEEPEENSNNDNGKSGNSDGNSGSDSSSTTDGGSGGSNSGASSEPSANSGFNANQQALINAGYYVVLAFGDGSYAVMVHGNESAYGYELLDQYLANMGYFSPSMTGGYISIDNDWYVVSCSSAIPIDTSGNAW